MKKFFLTLCLILMLLPMSVEAAENQSIIFSGSFSINNKVGGADTAWLYMKYYDTFIDSVIVSAESYGWGGWYTYKHECTNDSAWGWSGQWVYISNSSPIRLGETATVATARDSSYSTLTASDNIGINADDVDGDFDQLDFDLAYYLTVGYYNWVNTTRTITGADDAFYEIVGDTIRPIFNDSVPALMDSIYVILDSLYAIMDSLATQAWWSTSDCAGVGAYTCTLYVTDTLNDMRIPDVNVSINNQVEDAVPRVVQTNSNGFIIVQYSDGDYRATVNTPLYRNNEGSSPFLDFTVDGAPLLDSLMGYLQSVGQPVAAEACSVYGWLYDIQSAPVAGGTIVFELISDQDTLYYDNVTYVPGRTITESNSDGYWSISVVPNELLDTLSFYSVDIIRYHARSPIDEHYDVYVPDSTTVKLNDLLVSFNRKGK